MRMLMLGVMAVLWSGCSCTPADAETDLGVSCVLTLADGGRLTENNRPPGEYVTPRFAAECAEGVCLGNTVGDAGSDGRVNDGYCSRGCSASSECVANVHTAGTGTCRAAADAGSERFCWYP